MNVIILLIAIVLITCHSTGGIRSRISRDSDGAGHGPAGHDDDLTQSWNYGDDHGPKQWGSMFPTLCGESQRKQSPIDIRLDDLVYDSQLGEVDLFIPETKAEVGEDEQFRQKRRIEDGDEDDDGGDSDEGEDEGGDEIKIMTSAEVNEVEENEDSIETMPGATEISVTASNNGHTASISFHDEVIINGLGVGDLFRAVGLHFHWGNHSEVGSEHRVDGQQYPLEMHIVSYDMGRYLSLGESLGHHQSLAVLGVLFKIAPEDNPALTTILDSLAHIETQGQSVEATIPDLRALLPNRLTNYYRYPGSLTTPHCYESVVWTLFSTPQTISEKQMELFRNLKETAASEPDVVPMVNNWRPPQPLEGRVVRSSFNTNANSINYDNSVSGAATMKMSVLVMSLVSLVLAVNVNYS